MKYTSLELEACCYYKYREYSVIFLHLHHFNKGRGKGQVSRMPSLWQQNLRAGGCQEEDFSKESAKLETNSLQLQLNF